MVGINQARIAQHRAVLSVSAARSRRRWRTSTACSRRWGRRGVGERGVMIRVNMIRDMMRDSKARE